MSYASATNKKSRRKRRAVSVVPYASATSTRSQDEAKRLLLKLGCEGVGFFDDYAKREVLLQFKYRGRSIEMRVPWKGWAQLYLKEHPWNYSRRGTRQAYEEGRSSRAISRQIRSCAIGRKVRSRPSSAASLVSKLRFLATCSRAMGVRSMSAPASCRCRSLSHRK